MSRLRASAAGPTPSASVLASLAARITPGTALNLFVGKKPGRVVDWTASGASSLKRSRSCRQGRRVGGGQVEPIAKHRGVKRRFPGIGVADCRVIEQVGKSKSRFVTCRFQPVVELLAKRGVERAVDEVIGLLDPDLPAGLGKVPCERKCSARRRLASSSVRHRVIRETIRPKSETVRRWRR